MRVHRRDNDPEGLSHHTPVSAPANPTPFFRANASATTQMRLQEIADKSPQAKRLHGIKQRLDRHGTPYARDSEIDESIDTHTGVQRKASMINAGHTAATCQQSYPPGKSDRNSTHDSHRKVVQAKSTTTGNGGLPGPLRSGIETLSGYDMSQVRVHRNSDKPAQLNALAYTQGHNIYLGKGQDHHLPHEAWHVVQQQQGRVKPTLQYQGHKINDDRSLETEADVMGNRAVQLKTSGHPPDTPTLDTTGVIQRAVGFEFQTAWNTYIEIPGPGGNVQQVTLPKETPLYGGRTSGLGWTMETDGREIEFVVEPPLPESDAGVNDLTAVMGSMTAFIHRLEQHMGLARLTPTTHPQLFNGGGQGLVIEPNGAIAAQPQATVGIRLDRLHDLFAEMSRTGAGGDFARDGGTFYPARANTVATAAVNAANVNGNPASNELKGLLSLVVQYLIQGAGGGRRAYAKDIAFVMSRTDFASLFARLPPAERNYFQADTRRWVDYALNAANLAGTGADYLINQRVTDGGKVPDGAQIPLRRGVWLRDMALGTNAIDRFTAAATQDVPAYTDVSGGNRLRAPGLLGNTFDPVGPGQALEGVIVELRQMRRNIPADQWYAVARAVMLYAKALNSTADGAARPQYQR